MFDRTPTAADFASRRVTQPGQSEVVRQRLYDFNLYPAAGVALIAFFATQQGQGITTAQGAVVGTGKTYLDTNMDQANTLPSGMQYLAETIEVVFFPGSVSTANTYTPAQTSQFAAVAAAALLKQLDDVNTFYQSGMLEFKIFQKVYLRETPLAAFPPKTYFEGVAAIGTNSATTAEAAIANLHAAGRPYILEPEILLQPAVNFSVNLSWPAAVAMPSGFNGRVGVILDGYMMRASQ